MPGPTAERVFAAQGTPSQGTTVAWTQTVPAGRRWRLKHANVLIEAVGWNPVGAEVRTQLQSNASGSFVTIAESALETGRRVAYQGRGPISHILTPGQTIRAVVTNADARQSFYYAGVALEDSAL